MILWQSQLFIWPYRLTARTKPSQGLNQSSILCRVTQRDEFRVLRKGPANAGLFLWSSSEEYVKRWALRTGSLTLASGGIVASKFSL